MSTKPDIRFGPAGLGSPQVDGIKKCHKMGLRAAEVAFTYGVRMSNDAACELGKCARDLDVSLSVHAPYYINLASMDQEKLRMSRKRIMDSCERAHHMGAKRVVFHAGFYQKRVLRRISWNPRSCEASRASATRWLREALGIYQSRQSIGKSSAKSSS